MEHINEKHDDKKECCKQICHPCFRTCCPFIGALKGLLVVVVALSVMVATHHFTKKHFMDQGCSFVAEVEI